jgi:hypothetical protein
MSSVNTIEHEPTTDTTRLASRLPLRALLIGGAGILVAIVCLGACGDSSDTVATASVTSISEVPNIESGTAPRLMASPASDPADHGWCERDDVAFFAELLSGD